MARSVLALGWVFIASLVAACAAPPRAAEQPSPPAIEVNDDDDPEEAGVETSTVAREDDTRYAKKTRVDFDDDVSSTGTITHPAVITAKRRPHFEHMVRRSASYVRTTTRTDDHR